MKFDVYETTDKLGRKILLRNAVSEDAGELIKQIEITSEETPYLVREHDDAPITLEDEVYFVNDCLESEKALLLIVFVEGDLAGGCMISPVDDYKRYAHRCEVSITLYQKYCGSGIGSVLLEKSLDFAKKAGYEQAELEVVSTNIGAIHLYEKFGFKKYGTFPYNMKYSDGTYVSSDWMMKRL